MFRIIFNVSLNSPYLTSVLVTFQNTVSYTESFAPTAVACFLAGLLVVKANAILWLCSAAEADLGTLPNLR